MTRSDPSRTVARRRRALWLAVAGALTGLLAPVAPARADDASVARAYRMQDAASLILQRQAGPAFATFERTGRTGPMLGLLSRTRGVVVRTNAAVLGQASTPPEPRLEDYGLRALGLLNARSCPCRAACAHRIAGSGSWPGA